MMPRDHTSMLPPELLQHITEDFDFSELLPLLATSRRWREIALNAQAYWTSITLTVASDAAVNLFLVRLHRTYGRPFVLSVFIQNDWRNLERAFPAIRAHLHHVSKMDLRVHMSQSRSLLDYLCSPAPLLLYCYFAAILTQFDHVLPPFPTDLFGGHAPSLEVIGFCNVILPDESPVRAFRTVWGVGLAYYSNPQTIVPNVFPHFPNLRELRIQGQFSLLRPVYLQHASWSAVKVVRFDLVHTAHRVQMELLPLSRIPFVEIKFPSSVHIQPLLSHICGCAQVVFDDCSAETFSVDLADADGTSRSMLLSKDWLKDRDSFQHYLFTLPDLAHRIIYITLDCSLWDTIVILLPELSCLATVHVVFAEEIPPLRAVLECPTLRQIVFQSSVGRCRKLPENMFVEFASARFRSVCFPIAIDLKNILLDFGAANTARLDEFDRVFSLIRDLE